MVIYMISKKNHKIIKINKYIYIYLIKKINKKVEKKANVIDIVSEK